MKMIGHTGSWIYCCWGKWEGFGWDSLYPATSEYWDKNLWDKRLNINHFYIFRTLQGKSLQMYKKQLTMKRLVSELRMFRDGKMFHKTCLSLTLSILESFYFILLSGQTNHRMEMLKMRLFHFLALFHPQWSCSDSELFQIQFWSIYCISNG